MRRWGTSPFRDRGGNGSRISFTKEEYILFSGDVEDICNDMIFVIDHLHTNRLRGCSLTKQPLQLSNQELHTAQPSHMRRAFSLAGLQPPHRRLRSSSILRGWAGCASGNISTVYRILGPDRKGAIRAAFYHWVNPRCYGRGQTACRHL
jgi:hypothetical protein